MELSEVKVMHLQPGDTLVVRTETVLSAETAWGMEEYMRPRLPDGVKCIVLGPGINFEIVRTEQ